MLQSMTQKFIILTDLEIQKWNEDSLDFFIPRMVSGGVILLDDYACFETPGAYKALEESINDIDIEYPLECFVQVRHQHKPINCIINKENEMFNISFEQSIRGVTPGQSAVFYNKNICLGGGIISNIT